MDPYRVLWCCFSSFFPGPSIFGGHDSVEVFVDRSESTSPKQSGLQSYRTGVGLGTPGWSSDTEPEEVRLEDSHLK